jgi:DNA-directed RNA polymerase
MPNLIHSLDAASLILLYNKYTKISDSIFTVHDCFAVPIPYVESLIELLQSVYLDIYSERDYLKTFDKFVIENIKHTLGNAVNFVDNENDISKPKYIEYILEQDKIIKYPNVDLLFEDVADFNVIFDALKNKKAIYTII